MNESLKNLNKKEIKVELSALLVESLKILSAANKNSLEEELALIIDRCSNTKKRKTANVFISAGVATPNLQQ